MTTASRTEDRSGEVRGTSLAGLRLRLKPGHRTCGHVQGAWWPRSMRMESELPALVAALALRYGAISTVRYHDDDWLSDRGTGLLRDDAIDVSSGAHSRHVVSVTGPHMGRLDLLVVPPYTDAELAYEVVRMASSATDSSTPEQLLGPHAGSTTEVRAAIQRWEGEGGAPPRRTQQPRRAQLRTRRPHLQLAEATAG